jgi:hypothetical protein
MWFPHTFHPFSFPSPIRLGLCCVSWWLCRIVSLSQLVVLAGFECHFLMHLWVRGRYGASVSFSAIAAPEDSLSLDLHICRQASLYTRAAKFRPNHMTYEQRKNLLNSVT